MDKRINGKLPIKVIDTGEKRNYFNKESSEVSNSVFTGRKEIRKIVSGKSVLVQRASYIELKLLSKNNNKSMLADLLVQLSDSLAKYKIAQCNNS